MPLSGEIINMNLIPNHNKTKTIWSDFVLQNMKTEAKNKTLKIKKTSKFITLETHCTSLLRTWTLYVRYSKSIINFNPKTFNPLHHHHQPTQQPGSPFSSSNLTLQQNIIHPIQPIETTIHLSTQMFGILYKGRSSVGLDRIALLYFLTTL